MIEVKVSKDNTLLYGLIDRTLSTLNEKRIKKQGQRRIWRSMKEK